MGPSDYYNTAKFYLRQFSGLKTIPSVANRLVIMIDEDTSSLKDFEEIIRVDPTLVLRLLKLVNSAYFSLRTKIKDISEAVAYIGVDNLRNMIILDALKNLFRGTSESQGFSRNQLWLHCSVTSICCQMIAERVFVRKGEDDFLCGILHDIGLIVEDQVAPGKFKSFCQTYDPKTQNIIAHERGVIGTDHTTISYLLTREWGLSSDLSQGVKCHHRALDQVDPASHAGVLQIAEYLVSRLGYDAFPETVTGIISPPLMGHIRDNIMGYRAIMDDLPLEIQRAKEIYSLEEDGDGLL
ncbi:MAG TPA: signal transduction protein [Desulfobacteraceae bacterium]|nr:signal transduction protein [Desulfobacteraceae bacterium]